MEKSRYWLPSTSQTRAPSPRSRKTGQAPSPNWNGALLTVWLAPGTPGRARGGGGGGGGEPRVGGGDSQHEGVPMIHHHESRALEGDAGGGVVGLHPRREPSEPQGAEGLAAEGAEGPVPDPPPPPFGGEIDVGGRLARGQIEPHGPGVNPVGLDDVDPAIGTGEALLEPPRVLLQGDLGLVEGRAARLRIVPPLPEGQAVLSDSAPQGHNGWRGHTISHVRTVSSSMATLVTRPTTRSRYFGLIPKPGRLIVSMSRSMCAPFGMARAATRLRRAFWCISISSGASGAGPSFLPSP